MFDAFVHALAGDQPQVAPVDGVRLISPGAGVWLAERELHYDNEWRLPARMLVLEHAPGALTCYSPVALDSGTLEAIAGLGEVRLIVLPNRFHTMFALESAREFPNARLLAPASAGVLAGQSEGSLTIVGGEFSLGRHTAGMVVRVRGGLEEIVLYHDRAELLVVADLFFNLNQQQLDARLLRWFVRCSGLSGGPAQSRFERWLNMRQREGLAEFYRWAMGKPFSQISMAHGQLVSNGAREIFYQLFHQYAAS